MLVNIWSQICKKLRPLSRARDVMANCYLLSDRTKSPVFGLCNPFSSTCLTVFCPFMHADACVKCLDVLKTSISSYTGLAKLSVGTLIPSMTTGEVGSFPLVLVVRPAGWPDSQYLR